MPYYDYRIAVGSSVALASLMNVETLLFPYTRPLQIAPRTQPVDLYPIRTTLGSGRVRGDGTINHVWEWTGIKQVAVQYFLHTYLFSSGVSTAVTIYTRLHSTGAYARYNAYAILPAPGPDLEYIRQGIYRMTLRFSDLVAL
jgi:hypothetical protein